MTLTNLKHKKKKCWVLSRDKEKERERQCDKNVTGDMLAGVENVLRVLLRNSTVMFTSIWSLELVDARHYKNIHVICWNIANNKIKPKFLISLTIKIRKIWRIPTKKKAHKILRKPQKCIRTKIWGRKYFPFQHDSALLIFIASLNIAERVKI